MRFLRTDFLTIDQKVALFHLWNNEYPQDLQFEHLQALEDYLANLENQNHILLINDYERIIGWYFDFIRENARWFLAIVDSEYHGKNIGTRLLKLAQQEQPELNGWVITADDYVRANGEPYRSPVNFYRKKGFQVMEDIKLETEKITAVKIVWRRALGTA